MSTQSVLPDIALDGGKCQKFAHNMFPLWNDLAVMR